MNDHISDSETRRLKAEVKVLIIKGYIKPIPCLDDLSEETLQELIADYKVEKLNKVNETLCNGLINGISTLCKHSGIIPEEAVDVMKDELLGNEAFVVQSTNLIGKITLHIPMIGLVVGGVILGKYLLNGIWAARSATEEPEEEEV